MAFLSEEVIELGRKMTKFTFSLEEERLLQKKVEKDFREVQIALLKQHDNGFERAVWQASSDCPRETT